MVLPKFEPSKSDSKTCKVCAPAPADQHLEDPESINWNLAELLDSDDCELLDSDDIEEMVA